MEAGEVWKYGETANGPGRYINAQLSYQLGGNRLEMVVEYSGTKKGTLLSEKVKIYAYLATYAKLPPGE